MADVPQIDIVNGVPTTGTGTVKTLSVVADALATLQTALQTALELSALEAGGNLAAIAASVNGVAADNSVTAAGAAIVDNGLILTDIDADIAALRAIHEGWDADTAASAIAGDVADGAADTGNPILVGGRAVNAEPAAEANNDRRRFITDLVGKQIILPYANPENFVSGATAAMTGTTSTSLIAAPAAGLRNYITQIVVSNSHATVSTDVIIQDGSGGTALCIIPAAAVYGGAALTFPTPLRQPTTATAIFCVNGTTGASTRVSASGYKGV